METIPSGFNSVIAPMSSSISSLVVRRTWLNWFVPFELDVGNKACCKWSNRTWSYTLIPNFFLEHPFVFSVHWDTLSCQSHLFKLSTFWVYNLLYPKICPLISQRIILDPQVFFYQVSILNYNFPRKSFTREKWSKPHWKVKLWLLDQKIKFQQSYFIKTWNWFIKNQKSELLWKNQIF